MPIVDGKYVAPTGAARSVTYKPVVQDPQLKKLLSIAQKNNIPTQEAQPKLGILQRIFSGLGALSAGPSIKAIIERKDPVAAYFNNATARIGEAFTGTPSSVPHFNFEKDILERVGGQAKTPFGEVAQSVGGFLGDVLTDPITYFTAGTGGALKTGVGNTLLKQSASQTIRREGIKIAESTVDDLIRKGAITSADRVSNIRRIAQLPETGEAAIKQVTEKALSNTKGYQGILEKGGLKFGGKSIIKGDTINSLKAATVGKIPKPKIVDQLSTILSRDPKLSEEVKAVKQKWLDLTKYTTNNDLEKWKGIIASVGKIDDRKAIANAIEQGTIVSLPENLIPIAKQTQQFLNEFAGRGIQNSILKDVRQNYVPHFYDAQNTEDILNSYARKNRVSSTFANSKERTVESIAKAKELGLQPEEDIALLVAKYIKNFNRAESNKNYIDELVKTTGIPDNLNILQKQKDLLLKNLDEERNVLYTEKTLNTVNPNDVLTTQGRIDDIENKIAAIPSGIKRDETITELEKNIGQSLVEYNDPNIGKVLLPRTVVEDLKRGKVLFDDQDVTGLLKSYDKFLNFWKGSLTSIFPAFHARNAISNVAQNFMDIGLDAINIVRHEDAVMAMRGVKGDFITEIGTKYPYKKLLEEAKKRNILGGDFFHTEASKFVEQQLPKNGLRKAAAKLNLFDLGRGIGSGIENEARMVNWLSNIRKGMSLDQAAQQTKKFLFDYENMSRFEKDIMRRIIPFYTWTRKNISLQLHLLKTKPGAIATELKAVTGLGDPVSDDEKISSLPAWAAKAAGFKMGVDKFGRPLFVTGLGLPIEGFAQAMSLKTMIGMLSPLIKAPLELVTGQDFFRGKPIREVYTANDVASLTNMLSSGLGIDKQTAQDALQIASYERNVYANGKKTGGQETVYTMNPYILYAIRVLPTSRLVSTIGMAADQQQTSLQNFLRIMTGIKAYSFDPQEQQYFKELEQKNKLEIELKRRGKVGVGEYFYEKK